MTHNITKEEYLQNPCGVCSTAFWKNEVFIKPEHIDILHEKELGDSAGESTKYFRLYHDLREVAPGTLPPGLCYQKADYKTDADDICRIINSCYSGMSLQPAGVGTWAQYPVYDPELWLFIIDTDTGEKLALGIADYDKDIEEISLEWIQVLPEQRGRGLGTSLVNELLARGRTENAFATVSGETDNGTRPERLYRRCGFTGQDIWHVVSRLT